MKTGAALIILGVCLIVFGVIVGAQAVLDKPGASTSTDTGCGQSHAVVRVYPTKQRPDDVVMVRW